MHLGTIIKKLREEHSLALPLCLMWSSEDVRNKLPDGVEVTDEWCMRTLDDALVEAEEEIIDLINNIIANHIDMITDEDYKEKMF
jgi:hypothetical protein